MCPFVGRSVRASVMLSLFGLLGATYAVYTAMLFFFYFCFVIPQSHSVSWLGQGIASLRQVKPAHVMPGQAGSSRPKSYRHIASGRAWSSEVSPGLLTCLSAKDSRRIRRLSLPIRPIRRWIARSFPSRNRSFAPSLLGPKKCCRTLDCI